jgi:N-methylhydantoinase B
MQLNVDRHWCPPWGLRGGLSARPNSAYIEAEAGGERELVLKRDGIRLGPGARVILAGGGGGGWGDPLERAPEAVLKDVLAGYVSAGAAERDYGVAVDVVKRTATRTRRPHSDQGERHDG